jgi:hypothetical protein
VLKEQGTVDCQQTHARSITASIQIESAVCLAPRTEQERNLGTKRITACQHVRRRRLTGGLRQTRPHGPRPNRWPESIREVEADARRSPSVRRGLDWIRRATGSTLATNAPTRARGHTHTHKQRGGGGGGGARLDPNRKHHQDGQPNQL